MTEMLYPFVAISALAVALGYLVVWSRRTVTPRAAAVVVAVALIGVVGFALVEQLGRPKPVRVEWVQSQGDVAVLGSRMIEGKAIYLWLGLPGVAEPRAYVLPWSIKVANDLQKALEEAAKSGGEARGELPFERSWEMREPRFYALPQPKLPDKPAPPPAHKFEQDA